MRSLATDRYRHISRRRFFARMRGMVAGLIVACAALQAAPAQAAPDDEAAAAAANRQVAIAARIAGDDNRIRLVMEFERKPEIHLRFLENPDRIVLDLPETVFAFAADALQPRGLVTSVRYGAAGEGRARVVFELASPASMELVESTEEADGSIHRIVFDAVAVDRTAFAEKVASTVWTDGGAGGRPLSEAAASETLTVVIDAGHGGIDGGAEGPSGSMEKHITLAFAEALKAALEEEDGIRVAMTRTDDTFLSLSARVRRAREEQADLLISLHADSIRIKSLRGATVYTLSDKASDAVAQSLADQENGAETIVGANLENAPEAVAAILVDLARTETRVFSTGLARQVLDSFEGQVKLINNPLRHAGFQVLKAPDVPSVLVEMGYLSNPQDEKLLTDPDWRKSTAKLLAQSVHNYRQTILAGRR